MSMWDDIQAALVQASTGLQRAIEGLRDTHTGWTRATEGLETAITGFGHLVEGSRHAHEEHEDLRESVARLERLVLDLRDRLDQDGRAR
jgi:hypothetical protein